MNFSEDVLSLKGVGGKKAAALKKMGISTVSDLIGYYPRTYQDMTNAKKIANLTDGEEALITGVAVLTAVKYNRASRKETLQVIIDDGSARAEIVFFNAKFIKHGIKKGGSYTFFGKAVVDHGKYKMIHPEWLTAPGESQGGIQPIYPLVAGITQKDMRKWQDQLRDLHEQVPDFMPEEILEKYKLCSEKYAIKNIHFPENKQKIGEAKYRLIFDEFFLLMLKLFSVKKSVNHQEGIVFSKKVKCDDFIKTLPYTFTEAQQRTITEIEADMNSPKVMNRLVQGDVGSGKTAVAEAALYKAAKSGYQGAIMAPTEILARQHFNEMQRLFEPFGIKVGFLSGSLKASERKAVLEAVKNGEIQIVAGTHAIISEGVEFNNLGLVITDEQHRFGVNQRMKLGAKGKRPDTIVMTATPIPRTLAVVMYGDLDVSVIDRLPPGRKAVRTKAVTEDRRDKVYDFMEQQIQQGRQCYVVAPLIDESEALAARSATEIYNEVKERKGLRVELLHGDMKQQEKDEKMLAFSRGDVDVLISTVVIEVGINVPNATLMIIENSERFGLAQLHQLRGRVGRGAEQSYCVLIINSENKIAQERAEIMAETNDGFIIAEKDLDLRGPGEFFGTRQHGLPEFKLANPVAHIKVLESARNAVNSILKGELSLTEEEKEAVDKKLADTFGDTGTVSL